MIKLNKNSWSLVMGLALTMTLPVMAQEFQVVSASGNASLGESRASYAPALPQKNYKLGWWAKTESGASLVVSFSPDNQFRLLPASEVQVSGEGATSSGFRRVIKLNTGQIRLDLNALPPKSNVQVETPSAVCGAVGTIFTVDAERSAFSVLRGGVFASSKEDQGFVAKKVSGSFTLATGKENTFDDLAVSGSYQINGVPVEGEARLRLAKAKGGTGQAAVQILGGNFQGQREGAYLMDNGKLEAATGEMVQIHADYLQAASQEGTLNSKRSTLVASNQSIPATLDRDLAAATERATELRKRLFNRRTIRETVQDAARQAARPRP